MGKLSNLRASQVAPVIKKPPANAGDKRDSGSISGLWSCPGGGRGNPLQYSCLENPMDRGAWWATVHGVAESDMIKQLRTQAAIWKNMLTDFPGSPTVKTPSFHFRGQAFNPQSGNKHPACHRMRQKKKKENILGVTQLACEQECPGCRARLQLAMRSSTARWKLQIQPSTESAFHVHPRVRWVPYLSLNRAHLLSLCRRQQLQLRELFIHMLKHINYFSIYQMDVTKITSHRFAVDDWKHKITESKRFKSSLFFDSL